MRPKEGYIFKVKRTADGVIFDHNGFNKDGSPKPPASRDGFVTIQVPINGDEDEKVMPEDDNVEIEKVEVVEELTEEPVEEVAKGVDSELEKIKQMRTRGEVGKYIEETYGEKIQGMNRRTEEIMSDAEAIIRKNLE